MSATQTISREFLTALVEKEFIKDEQVERILEDEDLVQFFEKAKKKTKKKSSEERAGEYNPDKCSARIWKDGYDNIQCSAAKGEFGCFCKRHQKKMDENGSWWLGKIEDPRPKNPIHPTAGEHFWKTDEDGKEIVKPKKSPKKSETTGKKKRRSPSSFRKYRSSSRRSSSWSAHQRPPPSSPSSPSSPWRPRTRRPRASPAGWRARAPRGGPPTRIRAARTRRRPPRPSRARSARGGSRSCAAARPRRTRTPPRAREPTSRSLRAVTLTLSLNGNYGLTHRRDPPVRWSRTARSPRAEYAPARCKG